MIRARRYYCNGQRLNWGENLSTEYLTRLKAGEVFILYSQENLPIVYVLQDALGELREHKIVVVAGQMQPSIHDLLNQLNIMTQLEARLINLMQVQMN